MNGECKSRYVVRVPFPDEDLYSFLLDSAGKVRYYDSKKDAAATAQQYTEALIMEIKYYGF